MRGPYKQTNQTIREQMTKQIKIAPQDKLLLQSVADLYLKDYMSVHQIARTTNLKDVEVQFILYHLGIKLRNRSEQKIARGIRTNKLREKYKPTKEKLQKLLDQYKFPKVLVTQFENDEVTINKNHITEWLREYGIPWRTYNKMTPEERMAKLIEKLRRHE